MIKKGYKGRCVKVSVEKSKEICRTYSDIQLAYLRRLQEDERIKEIKCNVMLDGEDYSTDFLCVKADGDLIVRECVCHQHLLKPMTIRLLDMSREYWVRRGIKDWGIVTDAEK